MGFGHVDYLVPSKRVFTSAVGDDAARPLAFAVVGDRIEFMGTPADVIAACAPGTPVLDFGDAFICPGFHDAHLHFFHTALGASPYLLMHMGESEAELVARTVEFAAGLPNHAWVVTQGWRDYRWDPPVPPTKRSLDEAFPTRPCVMYSGDGHTLWMNTCALEALGVTRDSVPPQGGSYDRDENGELTGIIREAAAMELQDRYAGDEFPLLRAPGFKQFFDGVSSQHTAWLTEPYTNARFDGDCGRPTVPTDHMRELVLAAAERGHSVRIHTIGDRAIHEALDIFEEALAWYGAPMQGRNTLEHLENLLPADIDRLAELGILASSQPGHITLDPGGPERDLGEERSRVMWPFATYEDRGVGQAFGTDSPITAVTSMDVLYCAVTRQDPFTHEPAGGWLPGERISAAEALRIYTAGSAAAVGREHELGQIAPGYLADFVVLDRDITACGPEEIQSAQVLVTYVGGQRVYER